MSTRASDRRRAPRLAPDERLAPHITRRGRFKKLDPRKGRPLPSVSSMLAVLAWGGVVGMSFLRAAREAGAGE